MSRPWSIDTLLLHAAAVHPERAVVTPVFRSVNYLQADDADYAEVRYGRLSNTPNALVLGQRLAAAEGAEAALVTGSGMAAVSAALLSVLSAGDHLLCAADLYGGTATLIHHELRRLGVQASGVDSTHSARWAEALRPSTRAFYLETVSNPLLRVADVEAAVAFCQAHGLVCILDNTFLSPVLFRPLALGVDLVVHSATKALNGHSDVCAGVVAGSAARVDAARRVLNHLGGHLDAEGCFLLERGLKTLPLRVRRQGASALQLAQALGALPGVAAVHYPGLPTHPQHARAARLFAGAGWMLAFETHDEASAERLLARVQVFLHAASLGGVESLLVRPARSSHLGLSPEERAALGIHDRLIRVSVGVEDPADLLADLEQALGS